MFSYKSFRGLLSLLILLVLSGFIRIQPQPAQIQRGEVTVTFDAHGVVLQQVPFSRAFKTAPIVVITPRGEQGFVVTQFFADAFDGQAFALGARGEPGRHVTFYYVAVEP